MFGNHYNYLRLDDEIVKNITFSGNKEIYKKR